MNTSSPKGRAASSLYRPTLATLGAWDNQVKISHALLRGASAAFDEDSWECEAPLRERVQGDLLQARSNFDAVLNLLRHPPKRGAEGALSEQQEHCSREIQRALDKMEAAGAPEHQLLPFREILSSLTLSSGVSKNHPRPEALAKLAAVGPLLDATLDWLYQEAPDQQVQRLLLPVTRDMEKIIADTTALQSGRSAHRKRLSRSDKKQRPLELVLTAGATSASLHQMAQALAQMGSAFEDLATVCHEGAGLLERTANLTARGEIREIHLPELTFAQTDLRKVGNRLRAQVEQEAEMLRQAEQKAREAEQAAAAAALKAEAAAAAAARGLPPPLSDEDFRALQDLTYQHVHLKSVVPAAGAFLRQGSLSRVQLLTWLAASPFDLNAFRSVAENVSQRLRDGDPRRVFSPEEFQLLRQMIPVKTPKNTFRRFVRSALTQRRSADAVLPLFGTGTLSAAQREALRRDPTLDVIFLAKLERQVR